MTGKEPSEEIKKLVNALANALNEEVKDSNRIQGLLRKLHEAGYDASLTMAILVGLIPFDSETPVEKMQFDITPFDKQFLESLKIQFPKPPSDQINDESDQS